MKTLLRLFVLYLLIGCSAHKPVSHIPVTSIITTRTEALSSQEYPDFLSNYARLFVHTLNSEIPLCSIPRNYIPSDALMRQFPLGVMKDSTFCITGFLEVKENFDMQQLKKLGVYFIEGDQLFSTAFIPLSSLCQFLRLKGIIRFELTRLQPIAGNQAYNGNGVIIGIVDYGFDYTHPDFYDSTGQTYRIKQVWEQNTLQGISPAGFQYGRELTDQQAILSAGTDTNSETHGTHVTGSAAGSGAGTQFYGIAPKAELVLVSTNRTDVGIADGLRYIAEYAAQKNKPCVINFSLGSSIGPHDGTSAFDRLCDQKIRPGLLFTGSVGNNGNRNIFFENQFLDQPNDTIILSALLPDKGAEQLIADLWGEKNFVFSAAVFLLDTLSGKIVGTTPMVRSDEREIKTFRITTDSLLVIIQFAAEQGLYNQKPSIMAQVNYNSEGSNLIPVLKITSSIHGLIQGWLTAGQFSSLRQPYPYKGGNSSHTVAEIGGTGKSMLSAGAFCTKKNWNSTNGNPYHYGPKAVLGEIAYFSSHGPTADGRIKPDITCPGYGVVSAFSHFFTGNYPPAFYKTENVIFNNQTYSFGILQGTSIAAPILAGTLALWLQQNPDLTLGEIRKIMQQTATPTPDTAKTPNNTWGFGILNAAGGMQQIIHTEATQK
ncbi:MAG: S8 family serine peptidase [Bacteroidales bacterium]